MGDQEKRCSKCGVVKSTDQFHKRPDRPSGLMSHCKVCRLKYMASDKMRESKRRTQARYIRTAKGRESKLAKDRRKLEAIQQATPPWADLDAIRRIYDEADALTASTGIKHEVHHIIPILEVKQYVMGLHIPDNLEIVTAEEHKERHRLIRFCAKTTWGY